MYQSKFITLLVLSLFCITKNILAQETDTLPENFSIFDAHILKGTQMLPQTTNWIIANSVGYELMEVNMVENCDDRVSYLELEKYEQKPLIEIKKNTDNELIFHTTFAGNCGHSYLGDIGTDHSEKTIILLYTGYGHYAFCDCVVTLEYKISTEDLKEPYEYVILNNRENSKIKIDN